ncbi:CaiB/BaiF CoA transferase family protein [Sulfoacidibacillus thermotolerans]|uniref:CoA transferase n=1 Tax=Sulfoacidibacillus thermotolerans TaxID=1765684 RepID=A0A2U3DAK9_SULT2|nr:CaiB/BaiF CoA-transferase family protein [Sulfoacidibacillus thermotolerans]PWI58295.1 hypothetical protein BM613_03470 [Sulfoacidibacillus thermotolerans]
MWLKDLLVVDFTRLLPGPYATLRLADLGARVIKVEPPGGDPARTLGAEDRPAGAVFLANNRSKESVMLDLTRIEDRLTAQELMARADVIIESFRPDVAKRLGMSYDEAKRLNSRVVYCSLTGYGQTGALRKLAGHDLNYMAMSGMLSQLTDREGRPIVPHFQFADHLGAFGAVEAILAALYRREQTGEGCYLDVSMMDVLLGMWTTHALTTQFSEDENGLEVLSGNVICYRLYETSDHRFVSLGALERKFWENFCVAVDHPEWIPAHMTRATDENPVYCALRDLFLARDLIYWTTFGTSNDCCLQPVLTVSEALSSSYATAKQISYVLATEAWGDLQQVCTMAGGATVLPMHRSVAAPPRLDENRLHSDMEFKPLMQERHAKGSEYKRE